MATSSITIKKECSYSIPFTVKDSTGTAIDITGQTVFFTVKKSPGGSEDDSDAVIQKTITAFDDPTNGKGTLVLDSTDTNVELGNYVYDFKRKDGSANICYATGQFYVKETVTQRSS